MALEPAMIPAASFTAPTRMFAAPAIRTLWQVPLMTGGYLGCPG
jgi:hypothetical protein